MKRYRFRLEAVLRVRRLEEDLARARLLSASGALADACTRRDDAAARYREIPFELGTCSTEELLRSRRQAELAAATLAAREAAVDAAAREAERAREAWMTAVSRVKVLERLDERRREEHRQLFERDETRFLDDVGARPREDAGVH